MTKKWPRLVDSIFHCSKDAKWTASVLVLFDVSGKRQYAITESKTWAKMKQ